MRFLAVSYGTEGDTRPIVALCRGLMEAGHEVVQFGERSGAELAASAGVPYRSLAGDIRGALARALSTGGAASRNPRETARTLANLATSHTADWMQSLLEAGSRADAIVFSGLTSYVALSVAEHLGVRALGVGLQPVEPTSEFPNPFLSAMRVPRWCNRISHRVVMGLMWRAFRAAINKARASVTRQKPVKKAWQGYPVLYGISAQLVPQPRDWPPWVRVTGDWPLASGPWTPEAQLEAFLNAGEPPIYAGFGSMVGFDRKQMVEVLVEALQGRRALLSAGWSELEGAGLPPNVHPIGAAPHDRLFPRVSLVIHHGGAGTSHAAARAGVPSVVIPFAGDQFFWAGRLAKAGIAPGAIAHKSLTASALRSRIEEAGSVRMRDRAREVGRAISVERGIADAVTAIERLAARSG